MNSEVLRGEQEFLSGLKDNIQARVLRGQLVNLTLDWELAALALDARRYRASGLAERESLRDSATVYRKCVTALTEILSVSSVFACK